MPSDQSGFHKDHDHYTGTDRRADKPYADEILPVRLMRKLADVIDGIDLSRYRVGDRLPLPRRSATLLVAEGWAVAAGEMRRSDRRRK